MTQLVEIGGRARLPNGVRIVTVPRPHLARAHVGVSLRGGPCHEVADTWGMSHLVEHMVFRGTDQHPDARAVTLAADDFGGEIDAATYRDRVLYDTRVDADRVGEALELLREMMASPRMEGLEVEKGIIREELLESIDDDGQEIDPENLVYRDLFAGHPLARSIDGTIAKLDAYDEGAVRAFHQTAYGAGHMVVCAAGPVDHEAVLEAAAAVFGGLPSGPPPPEGASPRPLRAPPPVRVVRTDDSQTQLRLAFRLGGGLGDARRAAWSAMVRVLDGSPAARFPTDLIDRDGLAYELWCDLSLFEHEGALEIGASVAHDRAALVVEAVCEELSGLADAGPSPDELARTLARHRRGLLDVGDSLEDLVEMVTRGELLGAPFDAEASIARLASIDAARLQAVAHDMLAQAPAALVLVGRPPRAHLKRCEVALEKLRRPAGR